VLTFAEAIAEKTLRSTVALTAGRGRGKSAALGLGHRSSGGLWLLQHLRHFAVP